MLIKTLLNLIPEKGELRLTLANDSHGARLAIIPKPAKVQEESADKELLARQGAVITPIVLRFDPESEVIDEAISAELAQYAPHVTSASERLAQYEAEQARQQEEAAEAAKKKTEKAKTKQPAKAIGKDKAAEKQPPAPPPAPDLFSASVPPTEGRAGAAPAPAPAPEPVAEATGGDTQSEAAPEAAEQAS